MEYATFEGIIPEGQYGAGKVMIWDKGTFETITSTNSKEKNTKTGLSNGHLDIVLNGKKLKGKYSLIEFNKDKKLWLLIKGNDKYANKKILNKSKSVTSGLTIEEIV